MRKAKNVFRNFFKSETAGGFILIACTVVSLLISNSGLHEYYINFWHAHLTLPVLGLDYSIEHWVNDGLMAIFFLMVGLEIERELYVGELSTLKNAILPIIAAFGGMAVPAAIHFMFNAGTATQSGLGIPMATDIAFALGILALAGKRVPVALKIFLTALAIIDDLGAITVIALFYTKGFSLYYFLGSLFVFAILFISGKRKIYFLPLYIAGGIVMWYLMLKSGVHATIAGVLLAFAIPFGKAGKYNLSSRLENSLHYPVAFVILPIFALANTAIRIDNNALNGLTGPNSMGIIAGLFAGKFIGIFGTSYLAVKGNLASLAAGVRWQQIAGVAFLGGIGFTMSIFIANLAFSDAAIINGSKISILLASLISAAAGLLILKNTPRH